MFYIIAFKYVEKALKNEKTMRYYINTVRGSYYHLRITLFPLKIYLRLVKPYLSGKYFRWNTII